MIPIPSQIEDQLKKLPPAQRETAAKLYAGVNVSWKLRLFRVDGKQNDQWKVHAVFDTRSLPLLVIFNVTKSSYPQFGVISENTEFWVAAKIREVDPDGGYFVLENVTANFSQNETVGVVASSPNAELREKDNVKQDAGSMVSRIIMHPIVSTVLASLIVIALGYFIYVLTGVHLSDFS